MKKIIILHIILLIGTTKLFAQFSEEPYVPLDSIKTKQMRVIGLPVAFFTPETGFGFGGGGQLFLLRNSNLYNNRLSNILFSGIYTLNKQLLFDIKQDIYLLNGDYYLNLDYQFKIFPNSFWGVGNDTPDENEEAYNMTSHELSVAFLKRLPPYLNFGFELFYNDYNITEFTEGGILDEGNILGSNGATTVGLGVLFNQDKRDNISSPNRGNLIQLKAQFSSKNLGASSNFSRYILDYRQFFNPGEKSVLAFQFYSENIFGEVPFQAKAMYGGGSRARGYYRGRYMDDLLYVLQAEYRLKFHPRWNAAGFVLVGEVADKYNNFFDKFRPSIGGGVRFKILKDQDTLLRLDIGVGPGGNNGLYFGVNEAF